MAWTIDQQKAIDVEGNNVIVSAGAGSGKTAVLTERVKRKLLSGVSVNQLLVLTFTNAAAAEMKDRIRRTILKTPELKSQISLIDSAYITTFDSFALSIVKKYHTRLNISNKIKISDEVVIDLEKKKILDEIFEEEYLSPKSNFIKLINDFCLKDDDELKNYILNIYKKIELKYNKTKYLDNYFEIDNTDTFINLYLDEIYKKINIIKELFNDLGEFFDGKFIDKMNIAFSKLLEANSYDKIIESLDFTSPRVNRYPCTSAKVVKNTIDDTLKEIKELCIYENINEIKEEINSTKSNIEIIIEILKKLDKRLDLYKSENEIYNFTDISRLSIKLVEENEDIREELSNTFNEILVDEYQDTNDTQEMFISLISHNNVYMVGDIKQSIYRFRNANPYLFKNKYDNYSKDNGGIKIDLLKNFRSRSEVLDNINMLFDFIMDDIIGGADYSKSHRMVFGNESYNIEGKTENNNNIDVITYSKDDIGNISNSEEEAFIIGNDIKDKINNHYQVFDKDKKILRDIEYSDFVILLDRSSDFDLYKKIFEYLQIPLSIVKEESLTKNDDILVIKNLLKLLICIKENKLDLDFKYSYISVCRSYLYRLSDEEIYDIFVNDKFINSDLYNKCLELVDSMDTMNLSSYLLYVLDEFNYEDKIITVGNVKTLRTRLEYLYNLCCSYEEDGGSFETFINYLDEIFENEYDLKFNVNTSGNNSCKIMTIHKSKGLEFPICYFSGFSKKFNFDELKSKILFDNKYGIILPKVDNYYKDTILKTLLKIDTRREEISERIRLLYVALTRVKEKMIIVIPEGEELVETNSLVPLQVREKYNSFLSIINSIYTVILPYIKKSNVIGNKEYLKATRDSVIDELDNDNLIVEELSIDTNIINDTHYSKDKLHLIEKEEKQLMEFGTKVHSILEEIDFNNYDLDKYNVSDNIKLKVNSFINSEFMSDKLNLNMYKEYEFIYNNDNTLSHGIIDLLLEDKDKMIIVDYKLKNIDDLSYDKQLNGYREFIYNKTHKKTLCYLYSILDEKVREVD